MSALIWENNMFSVRLLPWHGLGVILTEAPSLYDIPKIIRCNFNVLKNNAIQLLPGGLTSNLQVVNLETGEVYGYIRELPNDYEVLRDFDGQHFGFVKDSYVVLQNNELIELMVAMAGLGAIPETGGLLGNGETMWICCKTEGTVFAEEAIDQYIIITNTHGGGGAIKAVISPIRVVCNNTLNAALHGAKRSWSYKHTTNVMNRVDEAVQTLKNGNAYMKVLGEEIGAMKLAKITEEKAREILDRIVIEETATKLAKIESLKKITPLDKNEKMRNLEKIANLQRSVDNVRTDLYARYFDAPDLQHLDNCQLKVWNAISDYATHTPLHKNTRDYDQNLFKAIINDNNIGKAKLIDLGYKLAKAA